MAKDDSRPGPPPGDGKGRRHAGLRRPGPAINPLYSALRKQGTIGHILARHVEGASHMAEGYTRAAPATSACASAPRAGRAPT
jgi:glyoxylate carboligase